jgi:hypothetical protein
MVKFGALCALLGFVGASFAEPLNVAIERRVRVCYTFQLSSKGLDC